MKEKNIQELAKRMGLVTVEDMCQYTIAQLVVKIANKVNELVNEVWRFESDVQEILKTQNENIQYLLGEGLHLELENIFDGWVKDGTFDTLINQTALKKVNDRIDETNAQLLQKSKQDEVYPYILDKMRVNTSNRLYSSAIVTFVDDDGSSKFLSLTKPIFDEYGIIGSIGVIPSKVGTSGYMTEEELKELQKQGYSMLSHSYSHGENIFKPAVVDVNGVRDTEILNDYKKAYDWMSTRGFNGADTIVYPWGGFTDSGRYKNLARTYYNNGINASGGGVNEDLNDNMYLNRLFINKNKDIQIYKTAIDEAISKGGWLILGSHSNENEIEASYLRSIIEYIKEKNIVILPFIEANELKGNAINIGDYTTNSKFFVSRRGTTSLTYDKTTTINSCVGENGYNATYSINANNNVVNIILTLTSSSNNGVFTNQLKLANITSVPKLPMTTIIPCVVTTADSKVYVCGCVLNASTSTISISCHGTLEDVTNVKRIDINTTYVTK